MKSNILVAIGTAVLVYFLMRGCCGTTVTVVKHDTTYKVIKDTTGSYTPVVQFPPVRAKDKFHNKTDTQYIYNNAEVDTQGIISAYFDKLVYADTIHTQYGTAIIDDTVSRNHIQKRKVYTNFSFPQVNTTTTVTKIPPPRMALYIGPDVGEGLGASITLKTKKDHLIDAGYMFNLRGSVFYLSYRWKIQLK